MLSFNRSSLITGSIPLTHVTVTLRPYGPSCGRCYSHSLTALLASLLTTTRNASRRRSTAFAHRQRHPHNYNYNRDLLCAPYKQNDGALHCHDVLTLKAVLSFEASLESPVFQSAYRPFHLTETAIACILNDMIGAVDQGHVTCRGSDASRPFSRL